MIMPTINKKIKKIHKQYYKHINQSTEYYNTKAWVSLRNSFKQEHPVCCICEKFGVITPTAAVHHIRPFLTGLSDEERSSLFYSMDNLMGLCNDCHHKIHKKLSYNKQATTLTEKEYREL